MASSPAKSLQRYDLLDRIAVGGMAEVFRARAHGAHGFQKSLAIKRILPELARDPEFEDRFIAEAKLAVELTHANIVQVYDFGRFEGSLFIAMELVDGLDLASLLKSCRDRGELIRAQAGFQMAIEIARGLDYAHRHGVVHRDVSPSNILLSRAGEVKIADFGIALALGNRHVVTGDERRIMGKWRYMSPEQTRGAALDTRSDLFSAAAVMYEIFTGDKLFPGDDADEVASNIRTMPVPRVSEKRAGLPEEVDEVLGAALQRDPDRRIQKASEMLRALTEASYRSSLVATALDVADVVEDALGTGAASSSVPPVKGVDDLIRDQLLAAPSAGAQRRTAVGGKEAALADTHVAAEATVDAGALDALTRTLVRAGVDPDGVTLWEVGAGVENRVEENTVAAGPAAKRGARPTGGDVAGEPSAAALDASGQRPGRRGLLAVGGIAVAAGLALLVSLDGHRGGANPPAAVAVTIDAAAAARAALRITSEPPGAAVVVDGEPAAESTPLRLDVEPGTHTVELSLEGHRPWSSGSVTVEAGERVSLPATLEPLRAALVVRSRPEGARVLLDGELLGETTLGPIDVAPGADRELRLEKDGFKPVVERIELVAGEVATVDRPLVSAVVYGKINIHVPGSWADVSLRGKPLGRVPGSLRLPVGKHRLRLHNKESGAERTVDVEVLADRVKYYELPM